MWTQTINVSISKMNRTYVVHKNKLAIENLMYDLIGLNDVNTIQGNAHLARHNLNLAKNAYRKVTVANISHYYLTIICIIEKDCEGIFKYCLPIINDDKYAASNLGSHYELLCDYDNMMAYYLIAAECGDIDALINLGDHCEDTYGFSIKILFIGDH